jgi:hemoglobin/transferrin/lactoferrin receptor protein
MKYYFSVLLMCLSILASAQQIHVYNQSNLTPMEGVTIYAKGTNKAIQTNAKGIANLNDFDLTDTLIFKMVGFQSVQFPKPLVKDRVYLREVSFDLDEVVLTANKTQEKKIDIPQQIEVITARRIEQNNPQTSADVLAQSGKVYVQMSQQGGGSPILRGFEANRVLMVVDGVRMNNAIYRAGHLQNVITIDPNSIDRIEVMYGPGSVMYGSDALGGVMHFYTRKPQLSTGDRLSVNGSSFVRYSSANQERSGNISFNIGGKKLASFSSFTYKNFDDLRAGDNRPGAYPDFGKHLFYASRINGIDTMLRNSDYNIQKGSGYTQYDITQKFLYRASKHLDVLLNLQYSNSSDVPRYDRLTEYSGGKLKYAEWYYGPQTRLFTSLTTEYKKKTAVFDNARLIVALQSIDESRHDRRFGADKKRAQVEKVNVTSINADFTKDFPRNHELRYGAEVLLNNVESKATFTNINTAEKEKTKTRYPDGGSTMNTFAAYLTHRWEINKKLILSEGVRFSSVDLRSSFSDTTVFPYPFPDVRNNMSALNGSLGLVYLPGNDWRISLLGSSGFRSPNLDDATKFFDSRPGEVLVVSNPNLKPEYVYTGEFTVSKVFDKTTRAEFNAYYSQFDNIIVTAPFQLNGQDSIDFNGVRSAVQANQNKQSAYITGFTATLESELTPSFAMQHTLTYTYGRLNDKTKSGKDTLTPLDHIPPMYGQSVFVLRKKKFRTEFQVRYNAWKLRKDYRLNAEDNEDSATPQGMPGWCVFNLKTEYTFNRFIRIQASVENILDHHYRYFASGISAPGRNFVLALRANF